jgi:hypothetical protein
LKLLANLSTEEKEAAQEFQ